MQGGLTKGRRKCAVCHIVVGGADASRGEHKAAGADSLFQAQHCAADVPLIIWHTLNARQVHSPAASVSMLPEKRIAAVI